MCVLMVDRAQAFGSEGCYSDRVFFVARVHERATFSGEVQLC